MHPLDKRWEMSQTINDNKALLEELFSDFNLTNVTEIKKIETGNINSTYLVRDYSENYVLQKLNTSVFKNPKAIENNLILMLQDSNVSNLIPKYYKAKNNSYFSEKGAFYKLSEFIPNTFVREKLLPIHAISEAAYGYGVFYNRLKKLDSNLFRETIPDFHHLTNRIEQFNRACDQGDTNRIQLAESPISFLKEQIKQSVNIYDLIQQKQLPLHLVHNDAKFDNVLLNHDGTKFLKVIDLDTVMAGSFLFDFGDFVRSVASERKELDRIGETKPFNINNFKASIAGFSRSKVAIEKEERKLLYDGVLYMTLIQALRFLTDFLMLDPYFKIHSWDDNLVRTNNQIALIKELKKYEPEMRSYIDQNF